MTEHSLSLPHLSDDEFAALRGLIHRATGIALGDAKRTLLASRLAKRLRARGVASWADYHRLVTTQDPRGEELGRMINCVTTNKTSFFREEHHFDVLRTFLRQHRSGRLRIWSAGCSTGEEAYTIAMVVADELGGLAGRDVRILASDIDTDVLAKGQAGVYERDDVGEGVPADLVRRFFEPAGAGAVRVSSELRKVVAFRRINFVDSQWPVRTRFDAIFCRNVVIYFDQTTQRVLYQRLVDHLEPHGLFFAGHSESLHENADLLTPIGGTVYRPAGARAARRTNRPPPAPRTSTRPPPGVRPSGRRATHPPPAPHRPSLRPVHRSQAAAQEVAIQSGGVFASAEPRIVKTVLGSCVAACLFDPVARVGGMNHFMLPDGSGGDGSVPTAYGVHAMEVLINDLMKLGAQRDRLRAKVFGACHVLGGDAAAWTVPDRNAKFIREFCRDEGIAIVAERLGGEHAQLVRFKTDEGRAWMRFVQGADETRVVRSERVLRDGIERTIAEPPPLDVGVTLF